MIKLIVAMDENRLIGRQDAALGMPWHNKEDLQHFKETTLFQTIVMGRKTFEIIGKALPQRKTIVLSKQDLNLEARVEHRKDLIELIEEYRHKNEDLYICGGAKIYQTALPYCDELIISIIPGVHEGDTYFPIIDQDLFSCKEVISYSTFILKKYIRRT